jgi:hypothetical protein
MNADIKSKHPTFLAETEIIKQTPMENSNNQLELLLKKKYR